MNYRQKNTFGNSRFRLFGIWSVILCLIYTMTHTGKGLKSAGREDCASRPAFFSVLHDLCHVTAHGGCCFVLLFFRPPQSYRNRPKSASKALGGAGTSPAPKKGTQRLTAGHMGCSLCSVPRAPAPAATSAVPPVEASAAGSNDLLPPGSAGWCTDCCRSTSYHVCQCRRYSQRQ